MRLALIVIAAGMAFAQDAKLQFEVASVTLSDPASQGRRAMEGGPGSNDPGRFRATSTPLGGILIRAIGALGKGYQFVAPPWVFEVNVDIVAKVPAGTTTEQFNAMLLNLLVERFNVKLHRETRELAGYELLIAKGGLKMAEAAPASGSDVSASNGPIKTVRSPDGNPLLAPGRKGRMFMGIGNGRQRISARLQHMPDIVAMCEGRMSGKPVIDKTGLTGTYDFYIDFAPTGARGSANDSSASTPLGGTEDPGAPFDIAIESALGLKLQAKKLQIEVTVIDQMSKTLIEN